MKNFLCIALSGLFQHLPAVLDDDATSAAVDRSAVKTIGLRLCVCGDYSFNSSFDTLTRFEQFALKTVDLSKEKDGIGGSVFDGVEERSVETDNLPVNGTPADIPV